MIYVCPIISYSFMNSLYIAFNLGFFDNLVSKDRNSFKGNALDSPNIEGVCNKRIFTTNLHQSLLRFPQKSVHTACPLQITYHSGKGVPLLSKIIPAVDGDPSLH